MTLSFSTKINGQPKNYFIEKIWQSILEIKQEPSTEYPIYQKEYLIKFDNYWDGTGDMWHEPVNAKRHTMRVDPTGRWKAGNIIHPVINNRTKDRFQFAPNMLCKSTQSVLVLQIDDEESLMPSVYVGDDKESEMPFYFKYKYEFGGVYEYGAEQMERLAINDGFDSTEHFFAYFNKNERYNLIHWTDLKY